MSTAKSSKSVDAAREAGAMGPPEKREKKRRTAETKELKSARMKNAKFLSGFDMENGYWNVALDGKSKRLTAFGSECGSWMWRCLPQGMVSSGLTQGIRPVCPV